MKTLLWLLTLGFGAVLAAGLWIPIKAEVAQVLLERAWSSSQVNQRPTPPWPWADTWPVARLELPAPAQSLIVLAGDHGQSLAFGPGHLSASAAPGTSGAVVIAGHRDTHFKGLQMLERGSPLRLQDLEGDWHAYEVIDLRVVNSEEEWLDLQAFGQDRLVLITCYPFDSMDAGGPLRYVVEARATETTRT